MSTAQAEGNGGNGENERQILMPQREIKVELSGDKDMGISITNVLLEFSRKVQNHTRRNSGIAYLNMQTTRLCISVSRFRGESVEGQGGALHLILYDTSPLKVFMQMCTFVYKSSPLSTRALSIIYEDSERILSRL
jgi:hypothetical protein